MAAKILSVDDELDLEVLLTQYFRRQIRKGEYEFAFAHNGLEALQKLLETPDFFQFIYLPISRFTSRKRQDRGDDK